MSAAPQPAEKSGHPVPISAQYVAKVTASKAFRSSSSLPRLLGYYAERARAEPGETIKEFRVATEALGRGEDFDSRVDSVVRVTTARLRAKLDEYYAGEGSKDPVRLVIPKGAYRLEVVDPQPPEPAPTSVPTTAVPRDAHYPRSWPWLILVAVFAAFVGGYFAGAWSQPGPGVEPEPELVRLWGGMTANGQSIQIVYSNGPLNLVQDDGDEPIPTDWHTGIGEVEAVHRLSGVAQRLGLPLQLKRAALADWDEVVDVNVVYLGGPAGNPHVSEIGAEANFVFELPSDDDEYVIRNRDPLRDEPQIYSSSYPLERDYALVRLTRGFRGDQWMLLLAGLTTFGTAAAAEMVCEPDQLAEAWRSIGAAVSDELSGFECVVSVDVKDNVGLESRPIACRALAPVASPLP